ncbi:MAG: hypothetical protein RL513_106 [Pseudomonadota bacterium]|jgi:hypothetical protein
MKHDDRLISSRASDRKFRMRNGSTAAAVRARRLLGYRRGRTILVSAKRAEQLFATPMKVSA